MNKQTEIVSEKPLSTTIHILGGRHILTAETMHIGKLNAEDNYTVYVDLLQGSLAITEKGYYVLMAGTDYIVKIKHDDKTSIHVLTFYGGIIQLDDDTALAVVPFVQDGIMDVYIKIVQGEEFAAVMEFMEGKFQHLPFNGPRLNTGRPTIATKVH